MYLSASVFVCVCVCGYVVFGECLQIHTVTQKKGGEREEGEIYWSGSVK